MDKMRIIHVDDDPDIRDLTRLSFELDGHFAVESFSTGADALEGAKASPPDLMLLDVMMPEMDGKELRRRLLAMPQTRDIPVVFMTALSDRAAMDELIGLGAIGIISKPFDAIALADDLKRLIQDRLEHAQACRDSA